MIIHNLNMISQLQFNWNLQMTEATTAKNKSSEKHEECAKAFNELQKEGAAIQKKLQRRINKAK